jgi:hypothetical protein
MKRLLPVLMLVAVAAFGCATHDKLAAPVGLAKGGLFKDAKDVSALEDALTDEGIARMLDADVTARLPTSVAVVGAETLAGPYTYYLDPGRDLLSAESLKEWEMAFEPIPHITGVQPISPLLLQGKTPTLQGLRSAAAQMKCELLLVFQVSSSAIDNYNDAAALYWTFVGLWLVPGNVYEHRTVYQGVLLDTRTGVVLGSATGDCHLKRACPAAYGQVQEGKLAQEAAANALADFRASCAKLLTDVVALAAAPAS